MAENTLVPAPLEGIHVAARVSHTEIAEIAVAEIETRLRAQVRKLTAEHKALSDKITVDAKALSADMHTAFQKAVQARVDTLVAALSALSSTQASATIVCHGETGDPKVLRGVVAVQIDPTRNLGQVAISVSTDPVFQTRVEEISVLQSTASRLAAEILEVRAQLQDMSYVERRAKAEMAAHVLGQSVEGTALLAHLRTSLFAGDDNLLRLTGGAGA